MKRQAWLILGVLAVTAGCGSNHTTTGSGFDGGDDAFDDGGSADGTLPSDDGPGGFGTDGSSGGSNGTSGSSGGGSSGGSSSGTGSTGGGFAPDGSVSVNCTAFGGVCATGGTCCSGLCDPASNTCASSITSCAPATAACVGNTDCCSGACINGQCGGTQCLTIGAACPVAGNACCTGNCSGGTCKAIVSGSCVTANNACTSNTQCCSGLCGSNGLCVLGASYCIQNGDICYHANDCCGGLCSAPNGQAVSATNPGVCSQPASGGVNCTGVDGALCGGCGSCCSRLCAPYGPTGVDICQPAQGCRVEGDLCRTSSDCCGGPGTGVLGDGETHCSNEGTSDPVGVCMTPGPDGGGTCDPEGDVCHYQNYTCSISSARSDCCLPPSVKPPKQNACSLDPLGVPRCNPYTGEGDAGAGCIAAGNACSSADECCNGNPCVPDSTGALQCSATSCQTAGQSCTTNADCCAGIPCIAPPGSIQGTCTPFVQQVMDGGVGTSSGTSSGGTSTTGSSSGGTSTGGGSSSGAGTSSGASSSGTSSGATSSGASSSGSSSGGTCALYGQQCTTGSDCCNGVACTDGKCISPVF